MELQRAFGQALRGHRKAKGLSQESFTTISSRTYMSELERGLKNPTLAKIDELAQILGIHPLTLLVECYSLKDDSGIEEIVTRITSELVVLNGNP